MHILLDILRALAIIILILYYGSKTIYDLIFITLPFIRERIERVNLQSWIVPKVINTKAPLARYAAYNLILAIPTILIVYLLITGWQW